MKNQLSNKDITALSLKGFNVLRQNFIVDIASFCDIMFVQEHCLLTQDLHKIDRNACRV